MMKETEKKKHSTVALQRVSRFHPPVMFLLWFVWCWEWQIAQCEAGDSDMAEVVISGEVIYSVLWTEAGKQIKLLGERSRKILPVLVSLWSSALLGGLNNFSKL